MSEHVSEMAKRIDDELGRRDVDKELDEMLLTTAKRIDDELGRRDVDKELDEMLLTTAQRKWLKDSFADRAFLARQILFRSNDLQLAAPFTLKQAKFLYVCRICGISSSAKLQKDIFVRDFGNEHAHRSCLLREAAENKKDQAKEPKKDADDYCCTCSCYKPTAVQGDEEPSCRNRRTCRPRRPSSADSNWHYEVMDALRTVDTAVIKRSNAGGLEAFTRKADILELLEDEVRGLNYSRSDNNVMLDLKDIAVIAIQGIASIDSQKTER